MPDFPVKNQYRGINAHLHSFWQAEGKWNRFHNFHMGQLMARLKLQLFPMGYTAQMEESLQIRISGENPRAPEADILIRDLDPERIGAVPSGILATNAQVMALEELLLIEDTDHYYSSLAIYESRGQPINRQPIAWIELLTPTNKGSSQAARDYRAKRSRLAQAGKIFVELDYLHETPPAFERLKDYSRQQAGSHPYRIVILDPRPLVENGFAYLHEWDVDSSLPEAVIPLSGDDTVKCDFEAVYQKTFEEGLYGLDEELDYSQHPMNFERYSPADQARIARRMLAILKAKQANIDLETAPLPVDELLSLDEAKAQLQALTT